MKKEEVPNNLGGYPDIDSFVCGKLERFSKLPKTMQSLYNMMFSERENIMAEYTDGYRIRKTTYGEAEEKVRRLSSFVSAQLFSIPKNSIVGLYMENSPLWIEIFWALLMAGYRVFLLNRYYSVPDLNRILLENSVAAVLSDGPVFCVQTLKTEELRLDAAPCDPDTAVWADGVIFLSSGTSGSGTLCLYDGQALANQVISSGEIIRTCPAMKAHVDGQLKQLAFLPFFHVFGFIAVYIWFGFFSRTFVFLKDNLPQTLVNTVRKHRVTHIFAVPLLWETVYEKAIGRIRQEGQKTYSRFKTALALANRFPAVQKILLQSSFQKIREGLFGDSIRFMISGGGQISPEILSFFNGIGYPLANGYGMTETGITSVELSGRAAQRNLGSIGQPFAGIRYCVSDDGELLIHTESMADAISKGGGFEKTDKNGWFSSRDRVEIRDGMFFLLGRTDERIILKNGEKIDPSAVEACLMTDGVRRLCLLDDSGSAVLIASIQNTSSPGRIRLVGEALKKAITEKGYGKSIHRLFLTTDTLIPDREFKINRRQVRKRYETGSIRFLETESEQDLKNSLDTELDGKVTECFASVLGIGKEDIRPDADFFLDLGGTSLDYFQLLSEMEELFGVRTAALNEHDPVTVRDFVELIEEVS